MYAFSALYVIARPSVRRQEKSLYLENFYTRYIRYETFTVINVDHAVSNLTQK